MKLITFIGLVRSMGLIKIGRTAAKCLVLSFVLCVISIQLYVPPSYAAIQAVQFDDTKTLKRYQSLIAELRCLVCQNQNLADSDADLAKDLRRKTEEMLKAGDTDQAILEYMRERYGDFILYRPPLNSATSFLWLGPFALLFIAAASVLLSIKRKQNAQKNNQTSKTEETATDTQLKQVRDLLND